MIVFYFSLYFWCLRRPRRARGIASSPYALLGFSYYPFVTPGTACQGAVTAGDCVRLCRPLLVGSFTVLGRYGCLAPLLRPCANCIESLSLSESERCSYRSMTIDCTFRAHFNLWWARHGWLLIHPVSRLDGQFSRPPYFTVGVNLTAEQPSEPPRGGEHGAGAK